MTSYELQFKKTWIDHRVYLKNYESASTLISSPFYPVSEELALHLQNIQVCCKNQLSDQYKSLSQAINTDLRQKNVRRIHSFTEYLMSGLCDKSYKNEGSFCGLHHYLKALIDCDLKMGLDLSFLIIDILFVAKFLKNHARQTQMIKLIQTHSHLKEQLINTGDYFIPSKQKNIPIHTALITGHSFEGSANFNEHSLRNIVNIVYFSECPIELSSFSEMVFIMAKWKMDPQLTLYLAEFEKKYFSLHNDYSGKHFFTEASHRKSLQPMDWLIIYECAKEHNLHSFVIKLIQFSCKWILSRPQDSHLSEVKDFYSLLNEQITDYPKLNLFGSTFEYMYKCDFDVFPGLTNLFRFFPKKTEWDFSFLPIQPSFISYCKMNLKACKISINKYNYLLSELIDRDNQLEEIEIENSCGYNIDEDQFNRFFCKATHLKKFSWNQMSIRDFSVLIELVDFMNLRGIEGLSFQFNGVLILKRGLISKLLENKKSLKRLELINIDFDKNFSYEDFCMEVRSHCPKLENLNKDTFSSILYEKGR